VNDTDKYAALYKEYKSIYKESPDKAKNLNPTFDMPKPKVWDVQSVRLKAFLDRHRRLYVNSLGDFEYLLRKLYDAKEQKRYEELVSVYREEYFRYQDREYENLFFLNQESGLVELAQNFVLRKDTVLVSAFSQTWQEKVEILKKENIHTANISELRAKEREILQAYAQEISTLFSYVNNYQDELSKLLANYSIEKLTRDDYALQVYFQESFDLADEKDIIEYLALHKTPNIASNIAQIRATIQNRIYENNKLSEIEIAKASAEDMGAVLLKFATFEQDIIAKYRSLVSFYYANLQQEADFMLVNEPFELYFDNYFADFELQLRYYKELYKGSQQVLVQTPYYMKMYNSTQAKMSITNINITARVQSAKKEYISRRSYLTDLKLIRREYEQEIEILLDEFARYAQVYIKEIRPNSEDLAVHAGNIKELRKRFDLRDEHGFF
jgi:hypothetical protein